MILARSSLALVEIQLEGAVSERRVHRGARDAAIGGVDLGEARASSGVEHASVVAAERRVDPRGEGEPGSDPFARDLDRELVITSYSIHYTKLYDAPVEPLLLTRDYPFMLVITLLLFIMAYGFRSPGRLNRLEGGLLVGTFCAYQTLLYFSEISRIG